MSLPRLASIILPVHNQADHIAATVQAYHAAIDPVAAAGATMGYEIILVPNACGDDSAAICRDLSARLPNVRTVESAAGGWGLAVRLGLAEARGDLLLYTNSARTDTAELMAVLQCGMGYPNTVIKATRHGGGAGRALGSALFNFECRMLFGFPWRDVNGTPKAFPRAFAPLMALQRDDDLIDLEFCAICWREKYQMVQVPMARRPRHGGQSTTRLNSALKMYGGALKLWRSSPKASRDA